MSGHESAADFIARIEALDPDELAAMNAAAITDEMTAAAEQDEQFFAEQAVLEEFERVAPLIEDYADKKGSPMTDGEKVRMAEELWQQERRGEVPDPKATSIPYKPDLPPDVAARVERVERGEQLYQEALAESQD